MEVKHSITNLVELLHRTDFQLYVRVPIALLRQRKHRRFSRARMYVCQRCVCVCFEGVKEKVEKKTNQQNINNMNLMRACVGSRQTAFLINYFAHVEIWFWSSFLQKNGKILCLSLSLYVCVRELFSWFSFDFVYKSKGLSRVKIKRKSGFIKHEKVSSQNKSRERKKVTDNNMWTGPESRRKEQTAR